MRELRNEVSRLYFLSADALDRPGDIRPLEVSANASPDASDPGLGTGSFRLEDVERTTIARALEATKNNKERAARLLGISRAGLYKKLKRLGLN